MSGVKLIIYNNNVRTFLTQKNFYDSNSEYYLSDYNFHCDISRITDWWSLYFLENKNKLPDSNWCSVEEEIEKVFKYNKYSENGITELDSMYDWRKYPPRDGVDFYGAIRLKNELYPKNGEDIFDYLLNELKKFEEKFIEYLFKAMPDDYSERAKT